MLWLVVLAAVAVAVGALGPKATTTSSAAQKIDFSYDPPLFLLEGQEVAVLALSGSALERIGNLSAHPGLMAVGVFFPPDAPPQRPWAVPRQITTLSDLGVLFVQAAASGSIPSQVGLLSKLQTMLMLDNSHLGGALPSQLGQLTNLHHLEAYSNNLHGQLPTQFGLLAKLTSLDLERNALSGTLPTELGLLSRLESLVVRENALGGALPSELALTPVTYAIFATNRLEGTIPPQLASWTTLKVLFASSNSLSGVLPSRLGLVTTLVELDLGRNNLSGTIPSQLALMPLLDRLVLDGNRLSGTLPPELCARGALLELRLSRNTLSGGLPTQLALLSKVAIFRVGHNGFATLPSQLGLMRALVDLELSYNPFGTRVPTEVGGLTALQTLQLSGCNLGGPIPSELGRLLQLRLLALDNNALEGTVPSQLALLVQLTTLLLHANRLHGTLPRQLVSLVVLETATTANNQLSGNAPASVWERHCDNSGLDSHHCEYACGACGGAWTQLRRCDWKGRGQWCVPWAVVGTFWAVCVGTVAGVYRGFLGQGRGRTAYCTARTSFAVLDNATDFLFAVNNRGWIGKLALSSLIVVSFVKVWHAARTMHRRGCVASVSGKAGRALVCAVASVDAAALHEAVEMDDQSIGMSIGIAALGLVESSFAGGMQLSVVVGGQAGTITWAAFVVSACNVVALSTVMAIMVLSRYHTKLQERKGSEMGDSLCQVRAAPGQRGSNSRRRLLALGCCCFAIAGVMVFSPTQQHPPAETARGVMHGHRCAVGTAWGECHENPLPRLPRTHAVPAVQKAPPCASMAGLAIEVPYVCMLGQLIMFLGVGGAAFGLDVVRDNPSLLVLIVEYLYAPLPPEIGQLSNLASLAVGRVTGTMATQIGLLSKLQFLDYAHSTHDSLVSHVGTLSSLDILRIRSCDFGGTPLPTEVALLSALTVLEFSHGRLPELESWIGRLTGLENLWLASNEMEGTLPSQLGGLTSLTNLGLDGNRLSGTLPSELGLLAKLTLFSIRGSSVEGSVPPAVPGAWVEHFDVRGNRLAGTFPILPEGTAATLVDVGDNRLVGPIPTQIGRASQLLQLHADANDLDGTLPTQLALLTRLTALVVGSNRLRGTVPAQLAALTALRVVDLSGNKLSGLLPPSFNASQRSVWLESCDWSGLDEAGCKRDCPSCALGTVELKGCDAAGHDQLCAPLFGVMIVIGLVALAMRLLLRALSRRKASRKSLALASAMSTLAAVHMLLDVLFARTARLTLAVLSWAAIAAAVVSRLVLVANEFVRLEKQGKLEKMQEQYKRFAIAVVLCVVDPPTLLWIAHTGSRRRLLLVRARVFVSMFLPDWVLVGVQAAAVSESGSSIALQALFASALSIVVALWLWCPAELRAVRASVRRSLGRAVVGAHEANECG